MSRVDQLLGELERSEVVSHDHPLRGAPLEEIERVERAMRTRFPDAYRRFLSRAGRSAGTFMQGSDLALGDLENINLVSREIAAADEGLGLPQDALVFLMHQGYEYLFVRTSEGDDPPVYHGLESDEPVEVAHRFTDWLEGAIADELRAEAALRGTR